MQLDVIFEAGKEVTLRVNGPEEVHLSGYAVTVLSEEEGDEDMYGQPMDLPSLESLQKGKDDDGKEKSALRKLVDGELEEDEDDDEDFDEDDEEEEDPEDHILRDKKGRIIELKKKKDDEEEKEEEEETKQPPAKRKREESKQTQKKKVEEASEKPEAKQQQKQQKKQQQKQKAASLKEKEQMHAAANQVLQNGKAGLKFMDIVKGDGKASVPGKRVSVNYIGKLENGKVFDQSRGRPFTFRLGVGEVIKGWDLGVKGMREGGKRQLVIPAHLAYGARGAPPTIPPNATLIFDVELLKAW